MSELNEDWAIAIHHLVAAHTAILRDVMRHLVEEELLPPEKAGRILLQAAEHDLPAAESTGETYDTARNELISIATALIGFPGSGRAQTGRGPKPDR
ncbi:hypothetical protein [Sphingomonas sp. CARO-RG-8B-R24-01]|uniref:hypothetical protein n=1 Tax=Sphingomonas sp. CARO-RG-8B-R24-01 TaxID=2914831 RepID=UPI001F590ABA|nr:hypothetical protein [Sphingomonas sp. CARO-RG-8B-R24-01]